MNKIHKIIAVSLAICAVSALVRTQEIKLVEFAQKDRSDVPSHLKWRIDHIYPSAESWEKDKTALSESLKSLEGLVEKCVDSPRDMSRCKPANIC